MKAILFLILTAAVISCNNNQDDLDANYHFNQVMNASQTGDTVSCNVYRNGVYVSTFTKVK